MPNSRTKHEFILLKRAIKLEIPILAYERGFLLLNLVGGGEIYYDNKIFAKNSRVLHSLTNDESVHQILIAQNSPLKDIVKKFDGFVNSYHSQAIKSLPKHFLANAIAEDKIIEAISFKDYETLPFLIGIQWNPRKLQKENPLSYKIYKEFLRNAEDNRQLNIP